MEVGILIGLVAMTILNNKEQDKKVNSYKVKA